MAAARAASLDTATFLCAAFYAGTAHATELHVRVIQMATARAGCAAGFAAPSLSLPPFQTHAA